MEKSWKHRVAKGKRFREKFRTDNSQEDLDSKGNPMPRNIKPFATEIDEDEERLKW